MTGAVIGARVRLAGLSKTYDGVCAVEQADLELAPGSFTALLGPSGCGKSTLLAMVAGLERPDAGEVILDGAQVTAAPAESRPIGLVFQKPLLFPHLTAVDNVAFGLRMRRVPRRRARQLAHEMLERVQLRDLGHRRVGELSGGQEQRVALSRALVLEPRLLLLDEPFSQLDAVLREQMRAMVRELASELKLTTLFVTHDRAEALDVADEIALMLDGRVAGQALPEVFYTRPPSLAAARFFGVTNELTGRVEAGVFRAPGVRGGLAVDDSTPGGPAVLVVRPERLRITSGPAPDRAVASRGVTTTGMVLGTRFAGTHQLVDVQTDSGAALVAHHPVELPVLAGSTVTIGLDPGAGSVFAVGPG
ncbi:MULTISPECIES: ABC transporter ATP-binding protein [unclassified Nocardioides]|uniref:ABC transporter ATP-binding protein n=1 Tax=unclassified Nocardioides TaxID=2615069 RepID=UPI0000570919|nr:MULTISPECIES: ABC transporter ATP-binding protein [unclassified Nocardioides]ABL81580.1 ABC transporter related protein [Nocardioides sp. JS614]